MWPLISPEVAPKDSATKGPSHQGSKTWGNEPSGCRVGAQLSPGRTLEVQKAVPPGQAGAEGGRQFSSDPQHLGPGVCGIFSSSPGSIETLL